MSTATKSPPPVKRSQSSNAGVHAGSMTGVPQPYLKVTRHDKISATMYVIVITLTVLAILALMRVEWEEPPIQLVPMQFVADGGYEDGNPDETLLVESPFEETPNPSPVEEVIEEDTLQEVLENVVELSNTASEQAVQVTSTEALNSGTPGSARGTGRPLGTGGGRYGGIPAEERWFIRFADGSSVDEYARQLDFFGIELGVLLPGRLVFISNMSTTPRVREVATGSGEERLYMTWQGGNRKDADVKLFQRAGIDASQGTIFHFYPPATEQLLATLEVQYAGRRTQEIRRTYFVVARGGDGFVFNVTRQVAMNGR
jgi:hypothetical protein